MAAKIDGLIPNQNYELIRDRIAAILMEELTNQGAISSPAETFVKGVWVERFMTFDQAVEFPCLNVVLGDGTYDNKDQTSVDGYYKYYIVGYTSAPTTRNGKGDTLAKIKLHRLLGMCRAILENPVYKTLDFPTPFLRNLKVGSITIDQPSDKSLDATNTVAGYLEFFVKVPEDVLLKTPVDLALSSTTVKLYNTDKGYMWGNTSTPPPTPFVEEIEVRYFIAES